MAKKRGAFVRLPCKVMIRAQVTEWKRNGKGKLVRTGSATIVSRERALDPKLIQQMAKAMSAKRASVTATIKGNPFSA